MLADTSGIVSEDPEDDNCRLRLSTCKINMACIGGPLIDFDGNFVGMNLRCGVKTKFVPMDIILDFLGHRTTRVGITQGDDGTKETSTSKNQIAAKTMNFFEYECENARIDGYPPLPMARDAYHEMYVVNSYEEEFPYNDWFFVRDDIASTMSECVVTLSSYNGDARSFACIGIIVNCYPTRILTSASLVQISGDGNKIVDNLQINVHLPYRRLATGTLKHYDLRYNVAVIDIMGFRSPRAMELEKHISFDCNTKIIAIGCLFTNREIMAQFGTLLDRKSELDCKELMISSCRITKFGIGGPLIDTLGNFVGMNFYHKKETPYLPREKIQELLSDAKWHSAAETTENDSPYSWPVPKPRWCFRIPLDDNTSYDDLVPILL